MKILLIQPPVRDYYFTAKRSVPYGLISIASLLRRHGYSVELLDALSTSKSTITATPPEMEYLDPFYGREDKSPFALFHDYRYFGYSQQHLGNEIAKSKADIVGVSSLFSAYSNEACEMARLVKEKLPQAIVIAGGHHPTSMPEEIMKEPSIDYAVRGEGEAVLPELIDAIIKKNPVDKIKGVVYRRPGGGIVLSEPAFMDNPDLYPLPAIDLINNKFYGRRDGGSMVISASRGCPMKCSYCCVASPFSSFRRRSVDSVFKEIETGVREYKVRFIDFEDENLTLDRKWFLNLMVRIRDDISEFDIELRAMNGLFPPTLDNEVLYCMKEAGFKTVNLSLCTTSKEQLKKFNRPDVRESFEKTVSFIKKNGMDAVCYVIAGAPEQNPLDSVDDLLYLWGQDVIGGVSVYYPAPGSADFIRMHDAGTLPQYNSLFRSSAIPISGRTSRKDSVTLLRLGRIMNFMRALKKKNIGFSPKKLTIQDINNDNAGVELLSAFLYDGVIRGIDSEGNLYKHLVSEKLTERFLSGLYSVMD